MATRRKLIKNVEEGFKKKVADEIQRLLLDDNLSFKISNILQKIYKDRKDKIQAFKI